MERSGTSGSVWVRRERQKHRQTDGTLVILASWGPFGKPRAGLLGRLGAILSVLERSFGDSGPSWPVLGPSLLHARSRDKTREAPPHLALW
eukprot:2280664-Pyramimonas_sp.AAC.1